MVSTLLYLHPNAAAAAATGIIDLGYRAIATKNCVCLVHCWCVVSATTKIAAHDDALRLAHETEMRHTHITPIQIHFSDFLLFNITAFLTRLCCCFCCCFLFLHLVQYIYSFFEITQSTRNIARTVNSMTLLYCSFVFERFQMLFSEISILISFLFFSFYLFFSILVNTVPFEFLSQLFYESVKIIFIISSWKDSKRMVCTIKLHRFILKREKIQYKWWKTTR